MRRGGRLLVVAAALGIWAYAGWDSALWDPRLQFALHLAAAVVIGRLGWMAWRGNEMPRTPLDLPIVALLLIEAAAAGLGRNAGLSVHSLVAMLATAAMLPVALLALRHHLRATALVVLLPIIGLATGTLVVLAWRRIEWMLAGGPGWPPVRLPSEGTPFGSVAVPPFIILAALPLAMAVTDARLRRWLMGSLLAIGIPLTALSGSRSAWVAIVVTLAILGAPMLGRVRRPGFVDLRRIVVGAAALASAVLALGFIAPRLTATGSIAYRGALWAATLTTWRSTPLLGIGPGEMAYARQTVAPLYQVHSHDVPLGILGDAGIAGLIAALIVFGTFAWVARPRAGASLAGRASHAAVIGLAIGFLTEDLTFLPNFNLLVVLMVAIALSHNGAVQWRRSRVAAPAGLGLVLAGMALAGVMLIGDAAAMAYRVGTDAAGRGDWASAADWMQAAVRLDPSQPMAPRALAVIADQVGNGALARSSAERAVILNPGDWGSWMNLAIVCHAAGDDSCALHAVRQVTASSPAGHLASINAALVYNSLGQTVEADAAYRRSLLADWRTSLAVAWPRPVPLALADAAERGAVTLQLNLLLARRTGGEGLRAAAYTSPAVRALAYAMAGDRANARLAIAAAERNEPDELLTWEIAALLARQWGEDDARFLRIAAVTRGSGPAAGPTRPATLTRDIASLRFYPGDGLVRGAERLLVAEPWPWAIESLLAP